MMTPAIDRKLRIDDITATQVGTDNVNVPKPHIVIIEDEEAIATALQMKLEREFMLKLFRTAEEALLYICQNYSTIDLIILDYMLAGEMDGLELLASIKQDPILKHLLIIFQSATDRSVLNKSTVKPDFYLEKPWTNQQMLNAITCVLNCSAKKNHVLALNSNPNTIIF